jgi:hypothetical protein
MKRNKTLSSKDFQQDELWCEMAKSPCCNDIVFRDSRFCSLCGKKIYIKRENQFPWTREEAYSYESAYIEGYKVDSWGDSKSGYHFDHKIVRDYHNDAILIYSTVYDVPDCERESKTEEYANGKIPLYDCVKVYSYTETYSDGSFCIIHEELLKEYPKLLEELNKNKQK